MEEKTTYLFFPLKILLLAFSYAKMNPQEIRTKITLAKHVHLNAHNNKVNISIGMVKSGCDEITLLIYALKLLNQPSGGRFFEINYLKLNFSQVFIFGNVRFYEIQRY